MVHTPTPPSHSGGPPGGEGWGPATSVRSPALTPGGRRQSAELPPELDPRRPSPRSLRSRLSPGRVADGAARAVDDRPWADDRSGAAAGPGDGAPGAGWVPRSGRAAESGFAAGAQSPRSRAAIVERGLPGWAALLVLLAIAGVGALIDTISGASVRGGFNIGIVVASVVAILVVRRSAMFPVVVAPPIVYSVGSGAMLYLRSNGLNDRAVLFDAATNWLVYGFPAIAGATAAVLIIAGVRIIARR